MEENIMETKRLPLIGDPAPAFETMTTNGMLKFPEDTKGSWVLLFSHPGDFTPVCTTEFMTLASMQEEFDEMNVKLIGLSVDSYASHVAWLKDIETREWNGIKDLHVTFPVIDDLSMDVANKYGMLHGKSSTATVRAIFIIDPEGIIRQIMYYPASCGRNFDEIKRIITALQTADAQKVATPADWRPGDDVIQPMAGSKEEIEKVEEDEDLNFVAWYLPFKKDKGTRKLD